MTRPQVVLSNDDGFDSPGIWALAEAVVDFADVWITAPREQYSGAGRCYFRETDGVIEERESKFPDKRIRAFAIGCSPAQSILHAVREILPVKPDLVISGINYGENLGNIVTSSGTVGVAIEAADLGIKALAVSLQIPVEENYLSYSENVSFKTAAWFASYFAKRLIADGLPEGVDFLKIDVPQDATSLTPWRLTRVSRVCEMHKEISRSESGGTAEILWYPEFDMSLVEADSDIYALLVDKVVSVSPMTIDLTAKTIFSKLDSTLRLN